ncbi:MAG: serine/threonine protein kinase [Deltaproteobacteria bacterium]|nr:MAG: serine/threonine protein kinase [Deltaproteobacteria bacterium]
MSYKLLAIEGSGAYGTVAKARDLRHGRRLVALKILREDHIDNPRVLSRTRDEAIMLTRLQHPAIVGVHSLDESLGRPIMVMEWLEAMPLSDLIDSHEAGLPIDVSCEMVAQASQALDYAYHTTQGHPPRPLKLVHRDLKPSNMLLTIDGQIKIVDFGLAHGDFDEKQADTVSMVLGTRAYMAPERLDGAEDDPSADVYAMGLVLSELLIGRPVKLSLNPRKQEQMLTQILDALPLDPLNLRARRRLRALVQAMCAYEPEDRPSHLDVCNELQTTMALGGLAPNVHAYARQIVKPMVSTRQRQPPEEHPCFDDVRFVEIPQPRLRIGAPHTMDPMLTEVNDERIRALLRSERWTSKLPRLRALLRDPAWTPAPFLEVIDLALEGGSSHFDPRKVAMCLNLLRVRPLDEVIERARDLQEHPDSLIANTARQFLDSV